MEANEQYLSDESLVAVFDLFNKDDITIAETYVGIKRASLHTLWIKKMLEECGHISYVGRMDLLMDNAMDM